MAPPEAAPATGAPHGATPAGEKRVVVGVDGSPASLRALAFAKEEARLRGARLHVVHAFVAATLQGVRVPVDYYEEVEREAEAVLDRAMGSVGTPGEESPETTRSVVAGSAAALLVEASRGAELLVLGSRGLGGFQSFLLGSVSMECVHHAHCPVAVVH